MKNRGASVGDLFAIGKHSRARGSQRLRMGYVLGFNYYEAEDGIPVEREEQPRDPSSRQQFAPGQKFAILLEDRDAPAKASVDEAAAYTAADYNALLKAQRSGDMLSMIREGQKVPRGWTPVCYSPQMILMPWEKYLTYRQEPTQQECKERVEAELASLGLGAESSVKINPIRVELSAAGWTSLYGSLDNTGRQVKKGTTK